MPDTLLLVEMGVLLLAIGAFAGVSAGLLGVGGGIVLVPAFFYAFQALGYSGPQLFQVCLATSLATIVGDVAALGDLAQPEGRRRLGDPEDLGARNHRRRNSWACWWPRR